MMQVLKNIKPERVMFYFEKLTEIPRESGNEKQVSDYLKKVGEELGYEVIQDESMNVIIKKPASPGMEDRDAIIIQGHMDMVCAKEKGKDFDFATQAIEIKVDGDFIRTEGTTLGADNGIAVAMGLALLEDKDAIHPKLELLFTTEEETGMDGAINVDGKHFTAKTLINIDSEEEGYFTVSCAGGVRVSLKIPYKLIKNPYKKAFEIEISGLSGGHSGMEINKGRANGIKLLGRLLNELKGVHGITSLDGGEKMNAIAKRAKALVSTNSDLLEDIKYIESVFKNEFRTSDPNLMITITPCELPDQIMGEVSTNHLINAMLLLPNGVQTMSNEIEGLVESSNNVGVMTMNEKTIEFDSAVRSSVASFKDEIVKRFFAIGELTGAKVTLNSAYPAWPYKADSKIRDVMVEVYEQMYSKKPEVMAIHAGLETGILTERIGEIDMISIGPDMWDVHTPNEHVSISSVERTYEFLKEVLQKM